MHYPKENIHRFIKDWYEYGASKTEQNRFDNDMAYRNTLIQTFGEQMLTREKLLDEIAKRCAKNAHRAYGQARNIAEYVFEECLDGQDRLQFDKNQRVRTDVEVFIFNRLVAEPPLDGNAVNERRDVENDRAYEN